MKTLSRIAVGLIFILPFSASAQIIPPPPPPATITVSDTCTVVDTDGNSHTYGIPGQMLGICALAAAKDQGAVSAYTLKNFSFGLYLETLNGIVPTATQFWDIYQNNTETTVGLTDLVVVTGDILKFQLTDFTNNSQIGSPVTFKIGTFVPTPTPAPAGFGGGGGITLHPPFDVALATSFILSTQHPDGSFDTPLLSDWAAIALKSGGATDAAKKLAQYFIVHPPAPQSVTDFERHAMALEALGVNPYSGTPTDYITPIVKAFDGTQIGDPSLVNDDIFAIFPLLHAGYTTDDDIVKKSVAFIVSDQKPDGSWEESVDLTAAAVQALTITPSLPGTSAAVNRAVTYLHKQEQADGGMGNSFSTSWTLQAIASLTDSILIWGQSYQTPQYYLAVLQQADGGVEPATTTPSTRIWASEYAIPGIMGKTWDSLLSSFEKYTPTAPTPAATSTLAVSTSAISPEVSQAPRAQQTVARQQVIVPVEPTTSALDIKQAQTAATGTVNGTGGDTLMLLLFIGALIALFGGIFAKLWRRE